jgi:hypothetical protein
VSPNHRWEVPNVKRNGGKYLLFYAGDLLVWIWVCWSRILETVNWMPGKATIVSWQCLLELSLIHEQVSVEGIQVFHFKFVYALTFGLYISTISLNTVIVHKNIIFQVSWVLTTMTSQQMAFWTCWLDVMMAWLKFTDMMKPMNP